MESMQKSKEQLVQELADLRQKVAQYEENEIKNTAIFKNNQRQFSLLYENVALSYQSLDEDGRFLTVNQAWLDLLGYQKEDVIGRWFGDLLIPSAQEKFRKAFPRLKNKGFVQSVEFEMIRQDGEHLIVVVDGRVEYDEQGQFQQTHCILSDVTAHKQTDLALQDSLKRFNLVMNSLDGIIYVADMETHEILFANQYAREQFGEIKGQICWQTLQSGQTGPCDFCTNKYLVTADGQPTGGYTWEFQNTINGRWYAMRDQAIPWVDGRLVRLQIANDITKRRQIQDALRESEARYRQFFENHSSIQWLVDPQTQQLVDINSASAQFYGYSREQMRQMKVPDLNVLSQEEITAKLKQAELQQRNYFIVPHRLASGEIRQMEVHTGPTLIEGRPLLYAVLHDVTDRVQAETRLREREQQYKSWYSLIRLMTDNVPDMIWAKDLEGRYIFANKAICKKLLNARDTDEPIGKTDMFFAQRERSSHPNDPEWHTFGELCINSDQVILDSIQPERFDEFGNVQGKFLHLDVYKAALWDAQEDMIGTVGSARIVTREKQMEAERRQAGEALRRRNQELDLLNQAREALNSSLELTQVLTTVLDEVRFLLGAVACSIWLVDDVTDELVCRQVTEPHSDVVRGWRLAPGEGIGGWVVENGRSLTISNAQDDQRHFRGVDQKTQLMTRSLLCVPLQVKEQVIGVLQVLDTVADSFQSPDLTLIESLAATAATAIENARLHERLADHATQLEQRVIERTQELTAANEQLKEFDRLKTKLIEDISHEIRTPVASLSLYLDLLEKGRPEKQDHYKTVLREKMNQLVRLTEDVLDVFRLDLYKGEIAFKSVDLNELIAIVVESYKERLQTTNLELYFEPDTSLPVIKAEQRQLKQVVANLLNNAIHYTSEGFVKISSCFDAKGQRVCLRVEDTGRGIPDEDLPYIFDRFYRGQNVGQYNIPGSGLGLTVVKEVVALHGGEVEVESVVGEGSLFRIWLPMVV